MNNASKNKLKFAKQKRRERKLLFKKYFGLDDENLLSSIFGQCYLFTDEVAAKKLNNLPKFPRIKGIFQPRKKVTKNVGWYNNINLHDESFYTDSTAFLKGTQSSNPHNDYSQYFVDTGQRPQNFIRDTGLKNRFEEYPKLRELIRLKDKYIADSGSPPMYLQADLSLFNLSDLNSKFDVIYIEPPLEEYNRMNGAVYDKYWSWSEIEALEIEQIAASRSFIWLWCGSGRGLNEGRRCLSKWGFRRCEDICWIKTNKQRPGHKNLEPGALFQRTKEHCLMGIKGTVRRSTDGDFIHANVDIDLIIDEEPEYGVKDKPVEIFHIIEHFCLGKRRLHLFGRDSTIRQGWLTVGTELTSSNFDSRIYNNFFLPSSFLVPFNEDIERLRPKSPPPRQKSSNQQQGLCGDDAKDNATCNVNNIGVSGGGVSNTGQSGGSGGGGGHRSRGSSTGGGGTTNTTGNSGLSNCLLPTPTQQDILAANLAVSMLSNGFVSQLGAALAHHATSTSSNSNTGPSTGGGGSSGNYGPTPSLLPYPSSSNSDGSGGGGGGNHPDVAFNPSLLIEIIKNAVCGSDLLNTAAAAIASSSTGPTGNSNATNSGNLGNITGGSHSNTANVNNTGSQYTYGFNVPSNSSNTNNSGSGSNKRSLNSRTKQNRR